MNALLADAVLLLHLGFIGFVACGGLLVLRRAGWAWAHVPALSWGMGVEILHAPCPLTRLENHLRERAGLAAYQGDFVQHYVRALIYPAVTAADQVLLAAALVVFNGVVYAIWLRRTAAAAKRRRQRLLADSTVVERGGGLKQSGERS